MPPKILVLQHQPDIPIEALGRRLTQLGTVIDVCEVDQGRPVPAFGAYDAMIVLGGDMNVWEEAAHPWLISEGAAIARWVDEDRGPFLGICLGHQLLAQATGGKVGPALTPEGGVSIVKVTDEGRADPLVGALPDPLTALHWHGAEVVVTPADAVLLATNTTCPVQAMRVGRRAWGVQFHPELSPDTARSFGAESRFLRLLDQRAAREGLVVAEGASDAAARYAQELESAMPALEEVTAALAGAIVTQI